MKLLNPRSVTEKTGMMYSTLRFGHYPNAEVDDTALCSSLEMIPDAFWINNIISINKVSYYREDGQIFTYDPIEWCVLKCKKIKDGEYRATMIPKNIIDMVVYTVKDDETLVSEKWNRSYYKKWLNEDFAALAFSDEERSKIRKIDGLKSNHVQSAERLVDLSPEDESTDPLADAMSLFELPIDPHSRSDYAKSHGTLFWSLHKGIWGAQSAWFAALSDRSLLMTLMDYASHSGLEGNLDQIMTPCEHFYEECVIPASKGEAAVMHLEHQTGLYTGWGREYKQFETAFLSKIVLGAVPVLTIIADEELLRTAGTVCNYSEGSKTYEAFAEEMRA